MHTVCYKLPNLGADPCEVGYELQLFTQDYAPVLFEEVLVDSILYRIIRVQRLNVGRDPVIFVLLEICPEPQFVTPHMAQFMVEHFVLTASPPLTPHGLDRHRTRDYCED